MPLGLEKAIARVAMPIIEGALNQLFACDPHTVRQFEPLAGKLVAIECSDLNIVLTVKIDRDKLSVIETSQEPDAKISGSVWSLMELTWAMKQQNKSLAGRGVTLTGDVELVQQLQRLLSELEIDWEAQLARFIGDVLAKQAVDLVRGMGEWGASAAKTASMNTTEYLQEEIQLLPTRNEVETFFRQISALRDDVERANLRLARLSTGDQND